MPGAGAPGDSGISVNMKVGVNSSGESGRGETVWNAWSSISEPGSLSGMADHVKNVLVEVLGVDAAEDFSLDDIELLARQGYHSKRSLSTATRDGLRHLHLPEARIDDIMTATGEFLTTV